MTYSKIDENGKEVLGNIEVADLPMDVKDKNYTYTAQGAILECTINHRLKKNPSVSISSLDRKKTIYGRVEYIDLDNVKISFSNYVNCIIELN